MNAHSSHAEQAVLGACLADPQAYWQVADVIDATDFYTAEHRAIWAEIASLHSSGKHVDVVTLHSRLRQLEDFPGLTDYATGLLTAATTVNARAYAELISGKSLERRVADAGARISKLHGPDTLADAQAILGAVTDRVAGKTKTGKDAVRDLVHRMQLQADRESDLLGVPYGFPMLDEFTAGLREGDLVLVAGRPSMGKSLLSMQIAMHVAQGGKGAHIVTLEMSTDQCTTRLLSALSNVPFDRVMDAKKLKPEDWPRVTDASDQIARMPLYFDDDIYDLPRILARIRQVHAQYGTRLAVIDYLTFMRMPSASTMALAVQEVTRELKATAKALGITILLVSQLNRQLEQRADKRPVLSDLRESGAIEQDADVVLMPYRDEYHHEDSPFRGFAEILIRKQRNGPTGMIPLRTRFDVQRFESAPDGLPRVLRLDETRPRLRGFPGAGSFMDRSASA